MVTRRFVCEVPHCRRRIFGDMGSRGSVAPDGTAGIYCPPSGLGARRQAGGGPSQATDVAGEQRHAAACRSTTSLGRADSVVVAGIDDWAFRKNHRYGTIICDLERRRIVALLPDRETATVRASLSEHPEIRVVSRDRGGGYGEATAKALPEALQVADRWHLMENASTAFLGAVRRSMHLIRAAIGTTTINPELLTCAEKLQYQGYLRRQETSAAIMALLRGGSRSKRSSAELGTAVNSFAKSAAAKARISSVSGRAHSTLTCHSWTHNGPQAAGMGQNSGAACECGASKARYVSSANGRRGGDERRR